MATLVEVEGDGPFIGLFTVYYRNEDFTTEID